MKKVLPSLLLASLSLPAYAADDWAPLATVSPTTTLEKDHLCYTDGKDIACSDRGVGVDASGNVSVTGDLTVGGQILTNSDLTVQGVTFSQGGISATGDISATNFYGDGSNLTNVTAASTDRLISGTTSVIAAENASITFNTAGTDRMVIGKNGNIGIGVDAPSETLHVNGNVAIPRTQSYGVEHAGNYYPLIGLDTGNNKVFGSLTSNTRSRVKISTAGEISLETDTQDIIFANEALGGEAARIQGTTGYMGINTAVPQTELEVAGTISATGLEVTGPVSVTGNALVDGDLTVNGNILTASDLTVQGVTFSQGGISATGDISATTYYGDGSHLTNLDASNMVMSLDDLTDAAANYTASYTIAIGEGTLNYAKDGLYNTAMGYQAGYGSSAASGTGYAADKDSFTGIGYQAGYDNSGDSLSVFGFESGYANTGDNLSTLGFYSSYENTGSNVTAVGYKSAFKNTGSNLAAFGYYSADVNTANNVSALGYNSAYHNSGGNLSAVGYNSGYGNTGSNVSGLGYQAAYQNKGTTVIGIGIRAAESNEGDNSTFIGYHAGNANTGADVVALGYHAGKGNTASGKFIVQQANLNTTPLILGDFATGDVDIAGTVSATHFYGDGSQLTGISASGVAAAGDTGHVQFRGADGSFAASNTFVWDNTNARLGIGTDSPSTTLHVAGDAKFEEAVQIGQEDTATCSGASDYGKLRYDATSKRFQICREKS